MPEESKEDIFTEINQGLQKKLDNLSELFTQYVIQESQVLQEDLKRIRDAIYASGMGS